MKKNMKKHLLWWIGRIWVGGGEQISKQGCITALTSKFKACLPSDRLYWVQKKRPYCFHTRYNTKELVGFRSASWWKQGESATCQHPLPGLRRGPSNGLEDPPCPGVLQLRDCVGPGRALCTAARASRGVTGTYLAHGEHHLHHWALALVHIASRWRSF